MHLNILYESLLADLYILSHNPIHPEPGQGTDLLGPTIENALQPRAIMDKINSIFKLSRYFVSTCLKKQIIPTKDRPQYRQMSQTRGPFA